MLAASPPRPPPALGVAVSLSPPKPSPARDCVPSVSVWKAAQPPVCCVCFDGGYIDTDDQHLTSAAACNADGALSVSAMQRHNPMNKLLVCDAEDCDVAVHPECYGVSMALLAQLSAPGGEKWRCDWCRHNTPSCVDEARCVLCPNSGGALKQLHGSQAWAHVACALWIPEVQYVDTERLCGVDIRMVHSSRWDKYCHLCEQTADAGIGACLSCARDGCTRAFHVSCALKWNLIEDVLLKSDESSNSAARGNPDILVPQLLCQQHCVQDTSSASSTGSSKTLHPWEQWRRQRPSLATPVRSELSIISRQYENVDLVDDGAAVDAGAVSTRPPQWQTGAADDLQRSFHDMYIVYDNERAAKVRQMANECQQLFEERDRLQQEIITLQKGKASLAASLEQATEQTGREEKKCAAMQRSLMALVEAGRSKHWDWSKLADAPLATPLTPPADLSSTEVTEYFLQMNSQVGRIVPCPVNVPAVDGSDLTLTLPNLSFHCGQTDMMLPPKKPLHNLRTCAGCHTRLLPATAPCLPQYRDTLLECWRCSQRRHLTCVEPPLAAPPPASAKRWQCQDCEQGKPLSLGDSANGGDDALYVQAPRKNGNSSLKRVRQKPCANVSSPNSGPPPPSSSSRRRVTAVNNVTPHGSNSQRTGGHSMQSPGSGSAAGRRPGNGIASATSAAPQAPPLKPMSMQEALDALHAACGPEPQPPATLLRMQNNCSAADVIYRAPVFDDLNAEDRVQITRCAMWRVVNNLPPGVGALDVQQMVMEGKTCSFGQFSLAFNGASSSAALPAARDDTLESLALAAGLETEESSHLMSLGKVEEAARQADQQPQTAVSPSEVFQSPSGTRSRSGAPQPGSYNVDDDDCDDEFEDDANDDDYDDEYVQPSSSGTSSRPRAIARSQSSGTVNSSASGTTITIKSSGLKPERQATRWEGDLYKPFWTRGFGKGKEGWCGICKPGIWLKTKTSVYWYHMHNFHGISSIAGNFFTPPMQTRTDPASGMLEGLCYQCKKWIPIQSDKPVNVEEIYWYKHAQKCHRLPPDDNDEFDIALVPGQRASEKEASGNNVNGHAGNFVVSSLMDIDG